MANFTAYLGACEPLTSVTLIHRLAPRLLLHDQNMAAKVEDRTIAAPDGGEIPLRIYWPTASPGPHPVVVFFHGGGWVIGNIESHDATVKMLAAASGMVFVSVDYRLAPEYKFPTPPEDCYVATKWVAEHAAELDVDASRLAIAGDSAGGNL